MGQRITDLTARASNAERDRDASEERLRATLAECREKQAISDGAAAAAHEKVRSVAAQLATAGRDNEHLRAECGRFKHQLHDRTRELREARASHAQRGNFEM